MRPLAILLAVGSLAFAGCGGSDKKTTSTAGTATTAARGYQGDVVKDIQAYIDAFGSGDYAKACTHIAKNTLDQLTQQGKFTCVQVYENGGQKVQLATSLFKGAKVDKPHVNGVNATVRVTSPSGKSITLPAVFEGGSWKAAT